MCLLKNGRTLHWIVLGVSVLVVSGWLAGCRRAAPSLDARFSGLVAPTAETTSRSPDQRSLRMAVAVVNSPCITLAHYARAETGAE